MVGVLTLGACSNDDKKAATTVDTSPSSAPPATESTQPAEPGFVFGYLRPGAGVLSQLATAQEAALDLAISDINDAGGVNGAPVGVIKVDEPLDGNVDVAINDLLDQGADLILGPTSSTGAQAALPTLSTRGSVACSASATADNLTTLDTDNVLYRTVPSDAHSSTSPTS